MIRKHMLPLLLALCLTLGLAAPTLAAETAAAIKLSKTTGTVSVSKSSGKALTLMNNMQLYNGYHVTTSDKSYAWMNLDDAKLIKEDASSEAEVRKSGKKLEVNTLSGSVFFNVSEKLEDDESLNIRTSTMIVGIRGTAGYVEVVDRWTVKLTVLEGVVQCSVTDPVTGQLKSEPVRAGETVLCVVYPPDTPGDKCDILREEWTVDAIPGYVLYDVVRDMDLCDRILDDTGTDIPRELAKKAGGDPSGRVPGGESATPEVLGEVQQRQDEDEEDLEKRKKQVEDDLQDQDSGDSPDKVFGQDPSQPSSNTGSPSNGSSSSGGGSGSPAQTATTATMPVTADQLQALLNQYDNVTLQPSGNAADDTLDASGLTVPAGKTLDVQGGIQTSVPAGGDLQVNGTLNGESMNNQGTTTVSSSNTLRLSGNLSGSGTLNVTATGRAVVEGSCAWGSASLTEGAQVLCRGGFSSPLPSGWAVSETADSDGYYSLEYTGEVVTPPPAPATYDITFDANTASLGATATVSAPTMTTGTDGTLASLPTAAINEALDVNYLMAGWYDGPVAGNQITTSTVFSADTTVYAHWVRLYTVTFTATDGQFDDGTDQYTATTGIDGKLSSLPHAHYTDGSLVLEGWFTAEDGGNPITTSTVFTEDTIVYAYWMQGIEVVFYNYYPDYTEDGMPQPDIIQTAAIGDTITPPADPTRAGYTFQGWATESDTLGTFERFDFENTTVTETTETVFLFGMWGPYTITFHVNSGPNEPETGEPITVETDVFGILAQENWPDPADVEIDGTRYELEGWSYTGFGYSEDGGLADIPNWNADSMVFNENKVLYAVWTKKLL